MDGWTLVSCSARVIDCPSGEVGLNLFVSVSSRFYQSVPRTCELTSASTSTARYVRVCGLVGYQCFALQVELEWKDQNMVGNFFVRNEKPMNAWTFSFPTLWCFCVDMFSPLVPVVKFALGLLLYMDVNVIECKTTMYYKDKNGCYWALLKRFLKKNKKKTRSGKNRLADYKYVDFWSRTHTVCQFWASLIT